MKPSITVITLGPGDPQLLTLQSADALRQAKALILRTDRHPVADWLREQGIAFDSFDALYDQYWDFDEMHAVMARRLWKRAADGPVVFAVIDATSDEAVDAVRAACPADGMLSVLPGVSRADSCLARQNGAVSGGIRIVPAIRCTESGRHPEQPLLITELDNAALAGDVKLYLTELYDDEMMVTFYPSTVKGNKAPKQISLCELDRQKTYDHTVSVMLPAVPPEQRRRFCFQDLLTIMERLRGENGCPWDREQTHESLRRCLIEEAWEVSAAIEQDDPDQLADELGDVLLQVVFHAAIGASHGTFSIGDVTTAICDKMIRRHPHIFGNAPAPGEDGWEQLKKQERGMQTLSDQLHDVPMGEPALMRSGKLQKRAARCGADDRTPEELLQEAAELCREVADTKDGSSIGRLLFAAAGAAAKLGFEPELLLQDETKSYTETCEQREKNGKLQE